MFKIQRIALIGGPGTGKTSVIDQLKQRGLFILPEISRDVIREARKEGIEQLFLTDPLAFSNRLLEGRIKQFNQANNGLNFYDRGIPDVLAYHRFTGDLIPEAYLEACTQFRYDHVFFFPPWESIYEQDSERYEDFEKSSQISEVLLDLYTELNYDVKIIPLDTIEHRESYILKQLTE
jgi:predicted ATPase